MMTMAIASSCASRKSLRNKQGQKAETSSSTLENNVSIWTNFTSIDTSITIAADTLEYSLPYSVWSANVCDDTCISINQSFDINTPSAKATFTKVGPMWKAKIIVPQKIVPITKKSFTQSKIDSSKKVVAATKETSTQITKTKEVKRSPLIPISVAAIFIVVLVFWLRAAIKYLKNKYL
jgi:multidrug transporter EmrE-like cation transporter